MDFTPAVASSTTCVDRLTTESPLYDRIMLSSPPWVGQPNPVVGNIEDHCTVGKQLAKVHVSFWHWVLCSGVYGA